MDAKAFAGALATVEQDHQFLADRVQALRQMVVTLMAPEDIYAPRVFGRLRELDNYFTTQFLAHMDEEEQTLFPLLEQFPPEGPALAERLRGEHKELRRKLDEFDGCLTIAIELKDRPPQAVMEDLLVYTWDLWEALDDHAHAETKGIQDCFKLARKQGSPAA